MKEYPILFRMQMVRALLAGKKTVTRRLSKQWLKVKAGDHLWVRETFQPLWADENNPPESLKTAEGWALGYPASDGIQTYYDYYTEEPTERCKPNIHMPRWASRITLEATENARVEWLQDITNQEAIAEGVVFGVVDRQVSCPCDGFRVLWGQLHTKPGERWEDNPEVVRIAFRRAAA